MVVVAAKEAVEVTVVLVVVVVVVVLEIGTFDLTTAIMVSGQHC